MEPIITAELNIIVLWTGSTSMSSHISDAIRTIEKLGIRYQLTPMGTIIEVSSIDDVFGVVKAVHEILIKKGIKRIVYHITIDDRRDAPKRMEEKVESVKSKI